MPSQPTNFGLLPDELSSYAESRVVVLPVPFERTTSYGKGTAAGPAAIVRASQSMELWDEELGREACEIGIATAPPFLPEAFAMEEAMAELQEECRRHLAAGKLLVTLGGEHSLTIAPVRAAREVCGPIGVVQFDAHADLRAEYEGTPYSHASVMRRVVEDGIPTLGVGIRSLSRPEAELVRERNLPVVWGHELPALTRSASRRSSTACPSRSTSPSTSTISIRPWSPPPAPPSPAAATGCRRSRCSEPSSGASGWWPSTASSSPPSVPCRRATSSPPSWSTSASATGPRRPEPERASRAR